MCKTAFDFVIFTYIFFCMNHGLGNAFNIYIDPSNANELIHDDVSMSCRMDNSDGDVKEVMLLELSRNNVDIALIRLNSQTSVRKGMESKFQADGKISTSAIYDSRIHVAMSDPEVKDSGSYSCFMFYLNQAGDLQEKRQSANLTVSGQDTKSAVKYLVDKVTGLEHELQERQKTESHLQGQITSLTNRNKALENKESMLRSQLASQSTKLASQSTKLASQSTKLASQSTKLQVLQDKINQLVQVAMCPFRWQYFKDSNSCLKGFIEKKTFSAARQFCQKDGGDLVKVDSQAKNSFVRALFKSGIEEIWIGLWDQHHTELWTYLDGSPLTYKRWDNGQPDNSLGMEACGQIWHADGFWNDHQCGIAFVFACEMPSRIQ